MVLGTSNLEANSPKINYYRDLVRAHDDLGFKTSLIHVDNVRIQDAIPFIPTA